MEQFLSILTGIIITLLFISHFRYQRGEYANEKRQQSLKVLREHGLDSALYIGTDGVNDEELRNAIDDLTCSGYIIIDRDNNVIGRLRPKIECKPTLRLIVSNDN